jgi:hypothetical protein
MTFQIYKSIPPGNALGGSFYEIVPVKKASNPIHTSMISHGKNG